MMWVWEVHVISSSWMTAYCCRCCRLGGCYCYWRSWQWRCSCPHCKRLGVGIWRFTCHGSVVSMEMRGFPSCKSQSILAREVGQSHLTSYDELGDTSGKKIQISHASACFMKHPKKRAKRVLISTQVNNLMNTIIY
jgi:hypothetical protein